MHSVGTPQRPSDQLVLKGPPVRARVDTLASAASRRTKQAFVVLPWLIVLPILWVLLSRSAAAVETDTIQPTATVANHTGARRWRHRRPQPLRTSAPQAPARRRRHRPAGGGPASGSFSTGKRLIAQRRVSAPPPAPGRRSQRRRARTSCRWLRAQARPADPAPRGRPRGGKAAAVARVAGVFAAAATTERRHRPRPAVAPPPPPLLPSASGTVDPRSRRSPTTRRHGRGLPPDTLLMKRPFPPLITIVPARQPCSTRSRPTA